MKRPKVKVEKRSVLGKKVRKLRKEGIFPANIYGKDLKSVAVQLPYDEFQPVYKEVGSTGLIDVELDGQARPVLIHNIQLDHLTRLPLHADFYQVNLKEKITTMVPVEIIGEPKAVSDKLGLLLQTLSEIEVEALPENLPDKIEVNVENLAEVDDQITVADIKTPQGATILTDPGQVVVKIGELVTKEAEAEAAAEAQASEEAKAESGAEEGAEAPAEGEEKKEEAPQEKPQE